MPPFSFEFVSNVDNKAGYSGSDDYQIMIPAYGFDTPIFCYAPWTGMFLTPYLRQCFQWGGFPALAHKPEAAAAAREELAFLTKNVLPI